MAGTTRNTAIEPDVDAAIEFCNTIEERPYLRLWASVFRLSVIDVCQCLLAEKPAHTKVMVWFWSRSQEPGSFNWLCELFAQDPQQARRRIVGRYEEILKKPTQGKNKHEIQ